MAKRRRRKKRPLLLLRPWLEYSSWRQFVKQAPRDGIKDGVRLLFTHRNDLWGEWRAHVHKKNHLRVLRMQHEGMTEAAVDAYRAVCSTRCYAHGRPCPLCASTECGCCRTNCSCVTDQQLAFFRTYTRVDSS
jgi:hypothetical protein